MKNLVCLILATFTFSVWASSFPVLQVTNDTDSRLVTLSVEADEDGALVALKQVTSGGGLPTTKLTIPLADAKRGAVLYKEGSVDVIKVKISDRFEPMYGGPVKLDYLKNGIKNTHEFVSLEAIREGDRWVIKFNNKTVKKAQIISNKFLGKVIGVDQMRF